MNHVNINAMKANPLHLAKDADREEITYTTADSSLGIVLVARSAVGICAILFAVNDDELERDLAVRFPTTGLSPTRSACGTTWPRSSPASTVRIGVSICRSTWDMALPFNGRSGRSFAPCRAARQSHMLPLPAGWACRTARAQWRAPAPPTRLQWAFPAIVSGSLDCFVECQAPASAEIVSSCA